MHRKIRIDGEPGNSETLTDCTKEGCVEITQKEIGLLVDHFSPMQASELIRLGLFSLFNRLYEAYKPDTNPPWAKIVVSYLLDEKKIQAIKELRQVTNLGLKEAKDIVEVACDEMAKISQVWKQKYPHQSYSNLSPSDLSEFDANILQALINEAKKNPSI